MPFETVPNVTTYNGLVPYKGSFSSAAMCPSGQTDLSEDAYNTPAGTTATKDMGYLIYENSYSGSTKTRLASNYAVNAVTDPNIWQYWGDGTRPYSDWFPFVFYSNGSDPKKPKPQASNMFAIKDSTKLVLVFDGLYAHGLNEVKFTLRHGPRTGLETNRQCNMVFLDGHAEAILGGNLPKTSEKVGSTPPMYDKNKLNTNNNGQWTVKFTTKVIK